MGSVNPSIDLAHDGEIAVVTIDNPPVNALKHEVRAGLIEAFQRVKNDAGVKAAVLACAGRTFIAGADITEFGKPRRPARAERGDRAIEAGQAGRRGDPRHGARRRPRDRARLPLPRRGAGDARLGLPEVKLGLLPGRRRHAAPAAPRRRRDGARR